MKFFQKLTALAVCGVLAFSLSSCMDLGVGENADDFKNYFSGVYVLSKTNAKKYSIEMFNGDIDMENTEIPVVVPYDEYSYIGFRVNKQYTVSIAEFAFFAKTEGGTGELSLDFYVVDTMPTSIKGEDGDVEIPSLDDETEENESVESVESAETSEENPEESADTEIKEDELFTPVNKFHTSTFSVGEEWDSVLMQFDGSKRVNAGQYVVVRIHNNCYIEDEELDSISFTFNYLLFYFTDAHKN